MPYQSGRNSRAISGLADYTTHKKEATEIKLEIGGDIITTITLTKGLTNASQLRRRVVFN